MTFAAEVKLTDVPRIAIGPCRTIVWVKTVMLEIRTASTTAFRLVDRSASWSLVVVHDVHAGATWAHGPSACRRSLPERILTELVAAAGGGTRFP